MKICYSLIAVVLLLVLAGCSRTAQVDEEDISLEQPPVETETRVVSEPEEAVTEEPVADIVEQKQMAIGGATDIKQENVTILSDIECEFGQEGPEKFSFKMTNTEEKKWVFNMLSYSARETSDTPILILNALQVTNGQLIESCGTRNVEVGNGVVCDFDLESTSNKVTKRSLRTGETAMGNVNENTLSLMTSSHAAEIRFLCE
ncbi:MAG: hypothetical protein V1729_03425 [Candidatus Woesearchaeota archaeon]